MKKNRLALKVNQPGASSRRLCSSGASSKHKEINLPSRHGPSTNLRKGLGEVDVYRTFLMSQEGRDLALHSDKLASCQTPLI
jgi:hypothetical protein